MPLDITVTVSSATYDKDALTITVNGTNFAENQYSGSVQYSRNGGAYTAVGGYSSWGDTQIVTTVAALLISGKYAIKVISGDNIESDPLEDAFRVGGSLMVPKWEDDNEE